MLSPKPGFSLNPEPWTFLTPSTSWTTSHGCSNEARSWFSPRRAATTPGPSSHIFHEVLSMHADLSVCDLCLYLQHLCRIHVFLYIYNIHTQAWQMCICLCQCPTLCLCLRVSLCKPPFIILCFYYLLPYYVVLWCYVLLCYAIYGFVMLCC